MITIPKKRVGRPTNKPSDLALSQMYERLTAKQIAEIYGVSRVTVTNWIKKVREQDKSCEEKR